MFIEKSFAYLRLFHNLLKSVLFLVVVDADVVGWLFLKWMDVNSWWCCCFVFLVPMRVCAILHILVVCVHRSRCQEFLRWIYI